jgi:hypothetical protein
VSHWSVDSATTVKLITSAVSAIKWLRRAGYIETEVEDAPGFRGSLTTLGLECMQVLPGSLKRKGEANKDAKPKSNKTMLQSVGELLSDMTKDGIKKAGAEKVKELANELFTVGTLLKLGALAKGVLIGG